MAKLLTSTPAEFKNLDESADWKTYSDAQENALKALAKRTDIWKHQIADGHAMYEIVKMSPLTLRLIPYGDAYEAPNYVIRGLRAKDVKEFLNREALWQQLVNSTTDEEAEELYNSSSYA